METRSIAAGAMVLGVLATLGCAPNSQWSQGQTTKLQSDYAALAQQHQELQRRAGSLDRRDEDQTQLVAQAQRQTQLLQSQVSALNTQLRDTVAQLNRVKEEKTAVEQKTEAMLASNSRRGGAMITANNSLRASLPAINIPDVHARADGDVARIAIPADRLFQPGGAQLRPDAGQVLDQVMAEVARAYPDQIIGIEGHLDNQPVRSGPWVNPHQLSVGRALSVFEYLLTTGRWRGDQFVVVGHGANHPIYSNAEPEGAARNRRIELVIYPDKLPGRE